MKCSICFKEIEIQRFPNGHEWKEGHNAQPINNGRCCADCNNRTVIPARMQEIRNRQEEEEKDD